MAADTAKDNRKDNDKERRFALVERKTVTRIDEQGEAFEEELLPVEEVDGPASAANAKPAAKELIIRFEYKAAPKGTKQEALAAQAVETVLADAAVKARWLDLGQRAPTEKNPQRTRLEKHLSDYTTKNTADYFIHKDLGGFLKRELDFYIKNEVMHLDDVQNAGAFANIEKNMRVIQCLRSIALELITFLAQLEDFQKKLWLKKKFVVSSHYCVTLDRVPQDMYPKIAANEKQWAQWHDLGMRDSPATGTFNDLKAAPYLMLDTALFDAVFRADLLKAIPDLDASIDGLLVHSDNFQALNLLGERYRETVKCVYIDPPYNTASNSIPYKNTFKHSAWATMMDNRIGKIKRLMPEDGAIFVSIDKHERQNLEHVLSLNFGEDNHVEELIWAMNTNNSQAPNYSTNHEYVLVYAKNRQVAEQDKSMFREPKPGFAEVMELVARLNPHYPPVSEIEAELRKLYRDHQIQYRQEVEAQGMEWEDEKGNDPWKGLFNYNGAEYRDANGRLVPEAEAAKRKAVIWVWRSSDASMPATKQSPTVNDPNHPNYRWYKPAHPSSGLPCPHPKSGWKFAERFDPDNPGKKSFWTLHDDGRIAWGPDEANIPQLKRMLHEVETNVGKSVFSDYSDGEKQTHDLFNRSGVFLAPKHASFVSRFVLHATRADSTVLDCFGGSGSTAHAVFTANRLDGGKRRYITVEQGDYFNTIIKPRMQKVVFSADWRLGKPTSPETGISHCFKVLKLEGYEDTLNNLQLRRPSGTGDLFNGMPKEAHDDYLLRYMLDVESRGSLLSVDDFKKPFDYTLNVAVDSAGAFEPRKIDLVETFNYLVGLAFWNATGSGKTLLLHVNIHQYLHHFQAGRGEHFPDKIILLTPNEGLSRQHLDELHLSGFGFAQHFNKAQTPPRGTIEIIDINKLGDEMGEKTVAVEAFEGNNLVLVDEGHRGTGTAAGAWMSRRDALVRGGFAFEYSATFGQAVAKGLTVATAEEDIQKKRAKMLFETSSLKKLTAFELARLALTTEDKRRARMIATREIYAKCILFDYSYKYFYEDGYRHSNVLVLRRQIA